MQEIIEYFTKLDTSSFVVLVVSAVVGLSTFIEITPIKINPWSSLFKWIGSRLMKTTDDKIEAIEKRFVGIDKKFSEMNKRFKDLSDDIDEKFEAMDRRDDEDQMDYIRWEILDFANSCRNNRKHTRDEFNHVINQNKKYERLLRKTGKDNGVYEEEYKFIIKLYHVCQDNNDFL